MRIAIRVDASDRIGTGHVVRCLTLASALKKRGVVCSFVHRLHPGHLSEVIRGLGFTVHELPPPAQNSLVQELNGYASWLGAAPEQDAFETVAALGQEEGPIDWLIVDHYAVDARWERLLKPYCRRLLAIDDLADRPHDCDFLLDQNWFAEETETRYDVLVPRDTVRLMGPQFTLFRPEYSRLRARQTPRDGNIRSILVFMGGSDPTNETAKVLEALMEPDLSPLTVNVVIGVNHPDPKGIATLVHSRSKTRLHQNLPSLANLMADADLMIGAGGTTSWERMCLGLPSIVMSIAPNQTPKNVILMRAGLTDFIGEMEQVTPSDISAAVRRHLANPEALRIQSGRMQALVPADGTERVVNALFGATENVIGN